MRREGRRERAGEKEGGGGTASCGLSSMKTHALGAMRRAALIRRSPAGLEPQPTAHSVTSASGSRSASAPGHPTSLPTNPSLLVAGKGGGCLGAGLPLLFLLFSSLLKRMVFASIGPSVHRKRGIPSEMEVDVGGS